MASLIDLWQNKEGGLLIRPIPSSERLTAVERRADQWVKAFKE